MRTVSKLTKDARRARAWRYTDRALLSGLTKAHEAEQAAEKAAQALLFEQMDCLVLPASQIPIESLKTIHSTFLPLANRKRP